MFRRSPWVAPPSEFAMGVSSKGAVDPAYVGVRSTLVALLPRRVGWKGVEGADGCSRPAFRVDGFDSGSRLPSID
eukprot:2245114-Heterocapsa_arctica.AAC.1